MYRYVRTSRGVTLVEMLGAIVVTTLLASGAWELIHHGQRAYQRGLGEVRTTQATRALLKTMTQDVQRAMAARLPHGITAPADHVGDRLILLTSLPPPAVPTDPGTWGPPQSIRYALHPRVAPPGQPLQRIVTPLHAPQSVQAMPVHAQVYTLQGRYFDGQVWHDAWQQAVLPQAVELILLVQHGSTPGQTLRVATLITAESSRE